MRFFSLVFQATQECPFHCPICLRHYEPSNRGLVPDEWRQLVMTLSEQGLKRLAVTGGEPTILGDSLFSFLEFVHSQRIHTSLSTTGFRITKERLLGMDEYLDHLLLSIRSLDLIGWQTDFGDSSYTTELYYTVLNILRWAQETNIILEVNTVVHKENINSVIELGWQLVELNPRIVWRIVNYYANGIMVDQRQRFEIDDREFMNLRLQLSEIFHDRMTALRFQSTESRVTSGDFLMTQDGRLMLSSDHCHTNTGFNVLHKKIPTQLSNLRSLADYKEICRDWGWGDLG